MTKNKFPGLFILAITMSILFVLTACSANNSNLDLEEEQQLNDTEQIKPVVKQINVEEFKERLETEPNLLYVLDIRNIEHFNENHLEGSINIPFSEVIERENELPNDQEIAVICYKGSSAKQIAKKLTELGYNSVFLEGGFEAINIVAEEFQLVN